MDPIIGKAIGAGLPMTQAQSLLNRLADFLATSQIAGGIVTNTDHALRRGLVVKHGVKLDDTMNIRKRHT